MNKLLDTIRLPDDIKDMRPDALRLLAAEIRELLVATVLQTGGHLASNLGVVELTLALFKVFDFPRDKIVWDVGHQAYVYKILSGRKDRFATLRQEGGLSGFPKREEGPFDAFNTGHSSTSISAALGIARARDFCGGAYNVVAVTGDGALTGGLCYEAMNDAGRSETELIVILNDNTMSISHNVGSVSRHLNRIRSLPLYFSIRDDINSSLNSVPVVGKPLASFISKVKSLIKFAIIPGMLFEELGFRYIGPVDGHNIGELVRILSGVSGMRGPVLVHVLTKKGMGYPRAESDPQKYHGVAPNGAGRAAGGGEAVAIGEGCDAAVGVGAAAEDSYGAAAAGGGEGCEATVGGGTASTAGKGATPKGAASFSHVFGEEMVKHALSDPTVVAISAAMTDGTGLSGFAEKCPKQFYDVGIAEQHALTLAAGMALNGLKPVAALYSTFLQRAYDQALHDICMQNAHVVLAIDRAGVVGEDGETHQGIYDIAFLRHMPNITIMAPAHDQELREMLRFALYEASGPAALRYPKGICTQGAIMSKLKQISKLGSSGGNSSGDNGGNSSGDGDDSSGSSVGDNSSGDSGGGINDGALVAGRGELLLQGGDITIVSVGTMLSAALDASMRLVEQGVGVELISARFIKPFDAELITASIAKTGRLLVAEDGCAAGGFGGAIAERLSGIACHARYCGLPDAPIPQGGRDSIMRKYGLDGDGLYSAAQILLEKKLEAQPR
ncbi:MAG: 1-deoxy-D-xylulose-5-phosphate synthase [Oscillospiraceae bacterium]|nr:1-deoxy-D-xylulose-5-phosphate synthase [Oscillospiraceae bacterium]